MRSRQTLAIVLNTFREAVRDRVLYNLIAFALILIASALLFGQISIGIQKTILLNVGLSAISVFGLLIAIFLGIGLVYKEMDKRSLYALEQADPPPPAHHREISGAELHVAGQYSVDERRTVGGSLLPDAAV